MKGLVFVIKKIQEHIVFSLIIVGTILYFSVLGLALVTDPEFMPGKSENILPYSTFSVISGTGAQVTDNALVFSETQYESVFSAVMPASDMAEIYVEFVIDCPEKCRGAVLHVDLLGENYDRAEQEFTVTLKSGINKVSDSIPINGDVPDQLQLRIFTLEPAEYSLTELSVTQPVPANRPVGTGIALGFTVAAAAAFCLLLICKLRKTSHQNGKI